MVDHLAVGFEFRERLMEFGDCGDLAGEVSVEELSVAGFTKQPWSGNRIVESAKGFNDIDAPPAGNPIGKPEQGLDSPCLPLESMRRQWPEAVGE
ncbi:hypothetical protein [Streptomyces sp. NPDC086182]|uniref:hypothetical protein n=1 Tax=Streptomyces sp. NPDC086182 TaxID=3155058 RepID=UPI003440E9D9